MVTMIDIKKQRESLGLYLKDVADFVGVSVATVSRWERGEIASIKSSNITKLAEVLHVNQTDIIGSVQAEVSEKENLPSVLKHIVNVWDSISDDDKAIIKIIADKYR